MPMTTASPARGMTRRLVVKSPSSPEDSSLPSPDQMRERMLGVDIYRITIQFGDGRAQAPPPHRPRHPERVPPPGRLSPRPARVPPLQRVGGGGDGAHPPAAPGPARRPRGGRGGPPERGRPRADAARAPSQRGRPR